jgi:hypothetical protein
MSAIRANGACGLIFMLGFGQCGLAQARRPDQGVEVLPTPPGRRIEPNDINWWGVTNKLLVAVRASGVATCHDLSAGREMFRFEAEDLADSTGRQLAFALATGENPVLISSTTDELENRLHFRRLPWGEVLGRLALPRSPGLSLDGVSPDGRFLYCSSVLQDTAWVIDVEKKRIDWTAKLRDWVQTGLVFAPDGQILVNFSHAGVIARDRAGHELWRRVLEHDVIEPRAFAATARLIVTFEDDAERVVALALDTGREVWAKKTGDFTEFRAISPDGKTQVFFAGDRLRLTHLPEDRLVPLDWTGGLPEAKFTPDGKRLVLVPALWEVDEDQNSKWYRPARRSRAFTVLNVQDNRVLTTIIAEASTANPASRPIPP